MEVQNTDPLQEPPFQTHTTAWSLIAVVGLLILVIAAGAIGYYFGTKKIDKPTSKPISAPTVVPQITTQPVFSKTDLFDVSNWKTYNGLYDRFTFSYPDSFSAGKKDDKIVISNNLPVTVQTMKPENKSVTNFEMVIENKVGTLNSLTKDTSVEKEQTFGKNTYVTAWSGVEGTGIRTYYISKNNNDWIVISFNRYLDNDVIKTDRDNPQFLNNDEQKLLVENILSTFQFTE